MNRLPIIIGTIDANSADSIAKMINPNAEITNPLWWIATLITIMLGIVFFLLRHFSKIAILDGRPKPHVSFLKMVRKRL